MTTITRGEVIEQIALELDGKTIDEAITLLAALREKVPAGGRSAIRVGIDYGYEPGDECTSVGVAISRPETDDEVRRRISRITSTMTMAAQIERHRQYLALTRGEAVIAPA